MEQEDYDPSWLGPDEENYTIVEPEFRGVNTLTLIYQHYHFSLIFFTQILWYFL